MIEIHGYSMKNDIEEMTIEEFELVTAIINDNELGNVEKYFKVMEKLGVPEEIMDNLTDDEFFDIVAKFNKKKVDLELVDHIVVECITYRAYTDKFILKVKDLSYIEKSVMINQEKFIARAIAVLFKREDYTKEQNYNEKHIEEKTKLFKSLSAAVAYPYVIMIAEKLKLKIDTLNA